MKLTYPACFYPDEEKDGAYAVVVPDLPGCVSGGNTLTIPAWLNTFAEKNHINFSQVLQDSLTAIYQQKQHA